MFTDIDNLAGLEQEARAARRDGFSAKALIHPKHVDIDNASFEPTETERAWAEKVVAAFADIRSRARFVWTARRSDRPHLSAAEKVLGL